VQLRRHDLVWLSGRGWQHLLQADHDAEVRECLECWFERRLPLVVSRQAPAHAGLALGLAAPRRWQRRRIALHAGHDSVLYRACFPKPGEIRLRLPGHLCANWRALCEELAALAADPRVHGSHGWQRITGLQYVTQRSDIDLHLQVSDAVAADEVVRCLGRFQWAGPRIDAELLFPDGSGVAWREWSRWRRGEIDRFLVKRMDGIALERGMEWLALGQAAP